MQNKKQITRQNHNCFSSQLHRWPICFQRICLCIRLDDTWINSQTFLAENVEMCDVPLITGDVPLCEPKLYMYCVFLYMKKFVIDNKAASCNCQRQCTKLTYKYTVTQSVPRGTPALTPSRSRCFRTTWLVTCKTCSEWILPVMVGSRITLVWRYASGIQIQTVTNSNSPGLPSYSQAVRVDYCKLQPFRCKTWKFNRLISGKVPNIFSKRWQV